MTRAPARATLAAALVAVLALAACTGHRPHRAATPTPRPTTVPRTGPLTAGPALAVKIDNTRGARPRVGLDHADVVYVEPVEGGLTRLMAVFANHLPAEAGPVRSARESDVDLLANYGQAALAYSGGSPYTLAVLKRGSQVNVGYDTSGKGYRRDHSRRAPYNLIGNPRELLARAGTTAPPKDIGFRFGPASPGGGKAVAATVRWPAARLTFTWDAGRGQYLLTTDGTPDVGADGVRLGAATVVLQQVTSHLSPNRDVNGVHTPVVQVVGGGKATVLRGGRSWQGTWSRAAATAPTSFTAAGKPISMAPDGPVWVLLVTAKQAVTLS